jgi:hypothetical protein
VTVARASDGYVITLYNDSSRAKYMLGTYLMRVRPILEEVARRNSQNLALAARRVVRRAIQQNAVGVGGISPFNPMLIAVTAGITSIIGAVQDAL